MTSTTMSSMNKSVAFKVIENLAWRTEGKDIKIYVDRNTCETRHLTHDELSAAMPNDFPIRIVAEFDERAFPEEDFHDRIEFVEWSVELKAGSSVTNILDVIKRMPAYGYWESIRPQLARREKRFPSGIPESSHVYILKLNTGT